MRARNRRQQRAKWTMRQKLDACTNTPPCLGGCSIAIATQNLRQVQQSAQSHCPLNILLAQDHQPNLTMSSLLRVSTWTSASWLAVTTLPTSGESNISNSLDACAASTPAAVHKNWLEFSSPVSS